jgi:DivIVA domain-containing protein
VVVIVIVLLGIVILAGVALFLSAMGRGELSNETVDHVDLGLPDRTLTPDDVGRLRFRTGLRGYRMEDVDAALAQIAASMRAAEVPTDQ